MAAATIRPPITAPAIANSRQPALLRAERMCLAVSVRATISCRAAGVSVRTLRCWPGEPRFMATLHAEAERTEAACTACLEALLALLSDPETPAKVRASVALGGLRVLPESKPPDPVSALDPYRVLSSLEFDDGGPLADVAFPDGTDLTSRA